MTTHRVTLFKLSRPEAAKRFEVLYTELLQTQTKNGKPYILSLQAGPTEAGDERNQGYTFASKTTFASLEDMRYYDDECAGHARLKAIAKEEGLAVPPVLTVYFTPTVTS